MPFETWIRVDPRNYVLDGVQIPAGRDNFERMTSGFSSTPPSTVSSSHDVRISPSCNRPAFRLAGGRKERKGKEEYLYSAFLATGYTQSTQAWITQFYLQTTPCLPFLRGVHQMSAPQQLRQQTSNCSSLLIYRPRKDERLSWPSWLTYSGWLSHISGHPSATGRVQDSESTPAKDRCSIPLDHSTN